MRACTLYIPDLTHRIKYSIYSKTLFAKMIEDISILKQQLQLHKYMIEIGVSLQVIQIVVQTTCYKTLSRYYLIRAVQSTHEVSSCNLQMFHILVDDGVNIERDIPWEHYIFGTIFYRILCLQEFKLCKVRSVQFGQKGIPYLNTYDDRTICYPDPLIKANDTIKIDLETNKIMDFIKLYLPFHGLHQVCTLLLAIGPSRLPRCHPKPAREAENEGEMLVALVSGRFAFSASTGEPAPIHSFSSSLGGSGFEYPFHSHIQIHGIVDWTHRGTVLTLPSPGSLPVTSRSDSSSANEVGHNLLDPSAFLSSFVSKGRKKIVKQGSFNTFYAKEYRATLEFYWAPFLVESNSNNPNFHNIKERIISPERIEAHAKHWKDVDYLIFNTYIWWMNNADIKVGRPNLRYWSNNDEVPRIEAYD
ncbi:hypothetical protein ACJX0J_028183, partial [Zea mays]